MYFLNQVLNKSRLLTILYDNLSDIIKSTDLYGEVADYLDKYTSANGITPNEAIEFYSNYIFTYNKHCKQFLKTLKYPFELGNKPFWVSREGYDIVLLFSILFTPHRFRIMQLLKEQSYFGNALIIGAGSGIEMNLIKRKYDKIHAYDLSMNKFLFKEFKDFNLNIELYDGQSENYFEAIYLIELLEHLERPFSLLQTCYESLKSGGKIFLTTATNIPQFDHLINFPNDHDVFEKKLDKIGFNILYKEQIIHDNITLKINSSNHFYIIEK